MALQRESKSEEFCFLPAEKQASVQDVSTCLFSVATGDEVVLGRGVQLHPGGVGSSLAVHHWLLSTSPRGIQHTLPLIPDHCCPHSQHAAHCTHMVSMKIGQNVCLLATSWSCRGPHLSSLSSTVRV